MKNLFSPVVLRNLGALFSLQIGNYIIPLLLVPYLLRVLGLDLFGTLMFALAFVVVARVCVSYGFDLTATRQVAISRDSVDLLSQLFANVVAARVVIWASCVALLMILSVFVHEVAAVRLIIVIAMLGLLGDAVFPVWLYQGMESMAAITKIRLGAKLANLVLVLIFVKEPSDILLVPLIEALTTIAGGAIGFVAALRLFHLRLTLPCAMAMKAQLWDGVPIFVSTMAVQLYTTANVIILGIVVDTVAVGAYSIAEKIYAALRGLLSPVVQAVFPAMARLHDSAREQFAATCRGAMRSLLPTLIAIALALFLSTPWLVALIAGEEQADTVNALRVFAVSLPFAIGSFLAPMLVVRRRKTVLMRVTVIGALLGLALSPLLAVLLGAAGAATAFLTVQIYNTTALMLASRTDDAKALRQVSADR